jgi:hypothetical protein
MIATAANRVRNRFPSEFVLSPMSVETVLLVFATSAAVLALWIDYRFPGLAPSDLTAALIRVVAALALGYLVAPALGRLVAAGVPTGVALLTLALPALVLVFLAVVWMFRVLQAWLYGVRR